MFYRHDNKIINLSNIQEIIFRTFGSGTKINPYTYGISFHHFGTERNVCINFDEDKATAEKVFNEIFAKLNQVAI